MRSPDNIEKLVSVRKPNITTGSEMDKRILDDSFAAIGETVQAKSADYESNLWRTIIRSRLTKLASAAAIIMGAALILLHQGSDEQGQVSQTPKVEKSPAELTTFASLTFAYRQGGMEMVEQMCDKALKMAGQRPANISLQEFFEEINNGKSERTEL